MKDTVFLRWVAEAKWVDCICGFVWKSKLARCPECGFEPGKIDFRDPVEVLRDLDKK